MADLHVNVAGVEFSNPLIAASGTFGFGREYAEFYPLSVLGGVSSKGITLKARPGNPAPRIAEAPGGMLNAVGLQNPGVDHFIREDLPWLRGQGTRIIATIAGKTPEDYCAMAEKLNDTDVDMIELNISCPNVKQGGVQFGTTCAGVSGITKAVRAHCKKPLMVKLSPNVTDISEMALAAESEGADAVSMINTLTGMRIDIRTRRPIIHNNTGGFSGPALYPVLSRHWNETPQDCVFPGGESMRQVFERASSALRTILAESAGKTVLVASHGCLLRSMACALLYGTVGALPQVVLSGNTSVSEFEVSASGVRVVRMNDLSHLPPELLGDPHQYDLKK